MLASSWIRSSKMRGAVYELRDVCEQSLGQEEVKQSRARIQYDQNFYAAVTDEVIAANFEVLYTHAA